MGTYVERIVTAGSSGKKWTFSAWLKLCGVRGGSGAHNQIWNCSSDNDSSHYIEICIKNTDKLDMQFRNGTSGDNGTFLRRITNRKFRDANAWYHLVIRMDTTQASNSDRFRVYINGVQETSFDLDSSSATVPQNYVTEINTSGGENRIGRGAGSSSAYWNGLMSHVHLCDDQSYAPTEFGETDSTTGEWKIKSDPSGLSYGTNGFFIFKNDSALTDRSGEGHNMSLGGGTLTKTEDSPSNIFCTLNKINSDQPTGTVNISGGNNTFADGEAGSNYSYASGTLAANSGKWYWETKVTDLAEIDQIGVALASTNFMGLATSHGLQATNYGGKGAQFSNGYKVGDGSGGAYMGAFSTNDIMMVALDLDNNKITFGRNGSWANGSGAADQTYSNSTAAYTNLTAGEYYFPAQAKRAYGSNYGTNHYNFGNGYFATTAVSSAGTNASGIGIFEYDVPTGFTALSTKGLNS